MQKHYKIKLKKNANKINFEKFLKKLEVEFKRIEYFPNYEIYKIPEIESEIKEKILAFSDVKRVLPMHRYYLNFKTKVVPNEKLKIQFGSEEKNLPVIGILDNGIYKNSLINSWLYKDKNNYCPEKITATHGTFVAGVILQQLKDTKIKIYDATLVPDFEFVQLEEDELLLRLKKAIKEHTFIKVWNLAISIRYSVEPNYISDFGILLDYLQETYDILIVKSVGNGEFTKEKSKKNLILEGADSARALVVGATNNKNEISSFSLTGKGHKILEKPDIATYGGDMYLNEEGKIKVDGIISLSPSEEVVSSFGTSFAAARTTGYLGELLGINREITPLFMKAFLANLAKKPQKYLSGYGYIDKNVKIKEEYGKIISFEGEIENEMKLELDYKKYKLTFSLACDLDIDYNEERYILADIDIKVSIDGKEIKNKYGKNCKLNSLKNYQYEFENKEGRVEILIYRRGKASKKNKTKKMKFCIITKNEK